MEEEFRIPKLRKKHIPIILLFLLIFMIIYICFLSYQYGAFKTCEKMGGDIVVNGSKKSCVWQEETEWMKILREDLSLPMQ